MLSIVKVSLVASVLNFTDQTFAFETPQLCCHTTDNLIFIDILMLVLIRAELGQDLDEETLISPDTWFLC